MDSQSTATTNGSDGQRQGLSPYMLAKNSHLAAAKLVKGSQLTPDEVCQATIDFKALWGAVDDHSTFQDAYKGYQESAAPERQVVKTQSGRPYISVWGGGSTSTPFTSQELHAYHAELGWPSDQEVFHSDEFEIKPVLEPQLDEVTKYNLWAIGREGKNIDRAKVPCVQQFECILSGFINLFELCGKAVVDWQEMLLFVEGETIAGSTEARWRFPMLLSGSCWNPKVFDMIRAKFMNVDDAHSPILALPSDVYLCDRPCMASDRFQMLDSMTSDEVALELVNAFSRMTLYECEYDIPDVDGTLMASRIKNVRHVGILWEPGQTIPLLNQSVKEKRKASRRPASAGLKGLHATDPFADAPFSKGQQSSGASSSVALQSVDAGVGLSNPLGGAVMQGAELEPAAPSTHTAGDFQLDDAMDCADCDSHVSGSDLEEYEHTFLDVVPPPAEPVALDVDELAQGADAPADADLFALFDGTDLGLGEHSVPQGGASSSSGGDTVGVAGAPAVEPWQELVGPTTAMGYIYYKGRSHMRIIRGNPKYSVTISCYNHPSCSFVLSEKRCPSDEELKKWSFEVGRAPEGSSSAIKAKLRDEHKGLALARWTTGKGRPKKS